MFNNQLTILPESIGNLTQLDNYSKNILTNIENNLKELKKEHKTYFHNNVFEELISKAMHPSRMSQFIEYDCDFDFDFN